MTTVLVGVPILKQLIWLVIGMMIHGTYHLRANPETVDLAGDRDDDSWDLSFAILREAGLAAESDVAGSSESHDTFVADGRGLTNTDAVSFEKLQFPDFLRHAALDRTVVLPDLPWETPACRSIFDDITTCSHASCTWKCQ